MPEDSLKRLKRSLDEFQSYFPHERDDIDIVVLRGHQLHERLLYEFIKTRVPNSHYIDSVFISWVPLLSLVRAMKFGDETEYEWVWRCLKKLADTRNHIAHNLSPEKQQKCVGNFVNCVRSEFQGFNSIPGDDNLKKAIFVVYNGLSTVLALEDFPSCTATALVREEIKKFGLANIEKGLESSRNA